MNDILNFIGRVAKMKWSSIQNNFWNIIVHLFAIVGATYFWTTEIGNKLIRIIDASSPSPEKLLGTSALDGWFDGVFTANTPVLVTFVFYFMIFFCVVAIIKLRRIDIQGFVAQRFPNYMIL